MERAIVRIYESTIYADKSIGAFISYLQREKHNLEKQFEGSFTKIEVVNEQDRYEDYYSLKLVVYGPESDEQYEKRKAESKVYEERQRAWYEELKKKYEG